MIKGITKNIDFHPAFAAIVTQKVIPITLINKIFSQYFVNKIILTADNCHGQPKKQRRNTSVALQAHKIFVKAKNVLWIILIPKELESLTLTDREVLKLSNEYIYILLSPESIRLDL